MLSFSTLPNFRKSKIDDCLEDLHKNMYVCSGQELSIYKIKIAGNKLQKQFRSKAPDHQRKGNP